MCCHELKHARWTSLFHSFNYTMSLLISCFYLLYALTWYMFLLDICPYLLHAWFVTCFYLLYAFTICMLLFVTYPYILLDRFLYLFYSFICPMPLLALCLNSFLVLLYYAIYRIMWPLDYFCIFDLLKYLLSYISVRLVFVNWITVILCSGSYLLALFYIMLWVSPYLIVSWAFSYELVCWWDCKPQWYWLLIILRLDRVALCNCVGC